MQIPIPTRRSAPVLLVVAGVYLSAGCEGVLGIREPSLAAEAPDADEGQLDADRRPDAAPDAGIDLPRLDFETTSVSCAPTGSAQSMEFVRVDDPVGDAVAVVDQEGLFLCSDPLGEPIETAVPLDAPEIVATWAGDLSEDDTDELVFAYGGGAAEIVEIGGEGDLNPQFLEFEAPPGALGGAVEAADVSGDGDLDIILGLGERFAVMLQTTYPEFGSVNDLDLTPYTHAVFAPFDDAEYPWLIALHEREGDARAFSVIVPDSGEESYYEIGDGGTIEGATGYAAALLGDGGQASVLVADTDDGLAVLSPNLADQTVELDDSLEVDLTGPFFTADLTGDGHEDLIGIDPSEGEGAIHAGQDLSQRVGTFDASADTEAIVVADLDDSGELEVVTVSGSDIRAHSVIP